VFSVRVLPPNDKWADAIRVPGYAVDWTGIGNTILATSEPGEPASSPAVPFSRTVWWRWTPTFTGWTRINWSGETLQFYRGNELSSPTQLPTDPRQGFVAKAGIPYAFRIANPFRANLGDVTISLHRTVLSLQPPSNYLLETNSNGALEIHVIAGRAYTFPVAEDNPFDTFSSLQMEVETPESW